MARKKKGTQKRVEAPSPREILAGRFPKLPLLLAVVLVAVGLLGWWLYPADSKHAPSDMGPLDVAGGPLTIPSPEAQNCASCHAQIFNDWLGSQHAWANRLIDPQTDHSAFVPAHHQKFGGIDFSSFKKWGKFRLKLNDDGYTPEAIIAISPLRQYLVPFPGGRWQVFEPAYDPTRDDWFEVFAGEHREPIEWGHWSNRGLNWNAQCAACHMTGLEKGYDEKTDSYRTTWKAMGISCAQCHAGLDAHLKNPEAALVRPNKDQIESNCASCHSRREELTGQFHAGEDYYDHFRPVLADVSRIYYPDGQVHDEDFEYVSLLMSRMHHKGVSCLNCHNPHSGKLVLPAENNALCLSCHTPPGANQAIPIDPAQHMFHKANTPGGRCINCHMPKNTYMQRDPRRDHRFGSPDPVLTAELGIPNACNRCHWDKPTAWAVEWTDKWYGQKMDNRSRLRSRIIARAQKRDASVVPELLELLKTEEIAAWKAPLIALIAPWIGQAPVQALVEKQLADPSPLVRSAAVRALSGDPAAAPLLDPLLKDSSRLVRLDAAWRPNAAMNRQSSVYRELREYLATTHDQPAGALREAQLALSEQRFADATKWSARAAAWDATSAEAHRVHGMVLSVAGQPDEAVKELRKASDLAPQDAQLHYSLALALGEAGQTDEVIVQLKKTVELEPGFGRAWYNLGLAHAGKEQLTEAAAALKQAEQLQPDAPEIPYALATVYLRLGRPVEAKQAAFRAQALGYPPAAAVLEQLLQ